jgi:hypothetical protein
MVLFGKTLSDAYPYGIVTDLIMEHATGSQSVKEPPLFHVALIILFESMLALTAMLLEASNWRWQDLVGLKAAAAVVIVVGPALPPVAIVLVVIVAVAVVVLVVVAVVVVWPAPPPLEVLVVVVVLLVFVFWAGILLRRRSCDDALQGVLWCLSVVSRRNMARTIPTTSTTDPNLPIILHLFILKF